MSNQLINRLMALLRALVLIVLLGTGLWLMDRISQDTMAGRMHPAASKTKAENPAPVLPQPPSTIPASAESEPMQDQAAPAGEASGRPPIPPAPVPGAKTADPAKKETVTPAAPQPKDGAPAAPNAQPAPGAKEAQEGGALPRIVSRPAGRYIVTEPILFNTAMATIRQVSAPLLKGISTLLKQRPEIKLLIIGYTDNLGLPENNQRVSNERAAAVKDYLTGQGIDPARLESKGMGSQNPIAPNNTQLGRQANRRIEFLISSPK